MYNPQELQRKAQLNLHGVDNNAQTNLSNNVTATSEENEQGWFTRGLATVGNVVSNILEGAIKSMEGGIDATAMLVGLFGADVDDFVSYDFTSDIFGTDEENEGLLDWTWGKNLEATSYWDNDTMVNQVAEGIGGMLPSIALSFIPYAGPILSKVGFFAGAMGNASETALKEGSSYEKALGYGALSGAIELGTEFIGGRVVGKGGGEAINKTLLGKLATRTGADKVISKGVGKVAYNFASEGLEEVAADLLDVANRRITGVEKDAKVDWAQLPKTFVVGGAVGAVLDGIQGGASAIYNNKRGGKHYVRVSENLENIANTNKALAYLQESKSISQDKLDKAVIRNTERTMDSLEEISKEFQAMTAEQRKSAFETLRESTSFIDNALNSDGTIKESVLENYSDVVNNGAKYNVSSNLLYNTTEVENDITDINKQKELNIELSDTTFDAEQRKNFAKINRNINLISKKTGTELELVVFKDNKDVNAFIDNNRIYIGEEHLKDGKWAKYLSHEISHFAKDSKEFKSFAEFIAKDEKALMDAFSKIINSRYDFTYSEVKSIVERIKNGNVGLLTAKENAIYDELVAHVAEDLFTNEESINRLARENTTIAQKILNAIKDFLAIFKGTNADRDTVVRLRKAEILFEKALDSIGKEAKTVDVLGEDKVGESKTDKLRFSRKIIDNAIDKAIKQKGNLEEKYNQIRVSKFPNDVSRMVANASNGEINLSDKYVAISGYDIWHEYQRHSNVEVETSRGQIPLTNDSIKEAVEAIYYPDMIESLFSTNGNPKQRKSFAYAKKSPHGYYIVVEAVGGRRNPNVVPVMILNFSETKWNEMMSNDYTLGELLYENDESLKNSLNIEFNKKNRVIVAQFASKKAIANTPHSPQFNNILSQDNDIVNRNEKFSFKHNDEIPDFDTVESLDKWFDSLSFKELQELVSEIEEDIKEVKVEQLPISKQERREIVVKRLYEQGTLNKFVTKVVKSKPQMEDYFRETKMNNKYNPLMPSKADEYVVMFHGTPEQFNEFDTKKVGKHGSVMGSGLYFTSNYSYAEDYKEYDDGRVIASILDIKKPLSRNKHEISKDELKTFIKEVVDATGEDFLSNYGDVYSIGYDKLLDNTAAKLLDYWSNDADLIEDIYVASRMDFDEFHNGLTEVLGYDGIIAWNKAEGTQAVVFRSNQVKEIFNYKPTKSNDIRLSRKQSDGEVTKKLANYTRKKVYSKVEAERTINTILESNFGLEDYNVEISGKTKAEAVDELWKNFNTLDAGKRTGAANKIADYIIDNAVMESYFAEAENDVYTETIDTLRPFLHSIDLSHIREEVKYRGDNSVYLLWGKKKGESGMTADQVAQRLGEQGIRINAENEADIFFEIDEMYRKAVKELKAKTEEQVKDYLSAEDRKQLRGDIAKAILRGYEENGKKSKFAEIVEEQSKNARKWKELYYEEKGRNSAESKLLYQVQKIRDIHFGDFQNASQADNKIFRGSIEKLSAIKNRGDLNKSGTRRIIAGLNTWYNEENPLLNGRYSQEISTALNQIASGEGNLTTAEIRNLTDVVAYFRHFIETANKIYRAGKYIDAMPIAEDYVRKLHDNEKIQLGTVGRVFDKTFNNSRANYMETFNDPMTVVRYMDKYDNGFFTQTMEEFRDCAVNAAILEMDLNAPLEDFYKKHKTFLKDAGNRMINYNGVQIPAIDAFNCYMALNREEGMLKLAWSGFKWVDKKGKTTSVDGFVTDSDFGYETVKFLANEVQSELEKQFTETDLEYIKIAEDLFNNRCKELKKERDLSRYGYSNVSDNYYIPIAVANVAKSIDVDGWQSEVDRVSNLSFNKATVKGAKNEMLIEPLNVVLTRHLRGIAQYYHLSNAVDNYDIIYNMDTGGNKNKVISVKSESKNVWQHGEEYMEEMLSDIQGIKKGKSSKMFGFVRSNYAKYQLGANPKVWFTQLSSFFASTSILDFSSVVKGLGVSADDVDVYCRLAELRNSDDTAARAQGNLSDTQGDGVVSKVSDTLMKPIGAMDRFVIKKLFGACQVQVQKDTGLKIGTEENKVKAGELLKKVILETQQNAIATERSMAMRSTSELMRTLTMFTSDSMKVIGRVIDAYGEITMLKARKRITSDSAELARLDAELKRANKKALKATASLVTQAVFMALIAQAFKTLYNKDDEEENIVENMTVDAIGNLFGGLPLFKDAYAKLVEGYDFDGYQYSAFNDLLDSTSDMLDLVGAIFNGSADSRDFAQNIRKLSYAIGQLFGIPVRNVYNVVFGLVNRVSPETGYKWNDKFYKQSYSKDLKRAIKNEDEEMIATIAGLIMDENIGSFENSATRKEISRLIGAEYDVLPQSVPSSVTINEETITLTGSQKKAYKEVYSQSITAIDKLVSTNGYKVASDDAKAKAVKYVYKYYYYEAQQKALNIELDSKLYLFGQVIPIDKMALILAEVPTIADKSTNKKQAVQRYLQGAKLTATQKYMLMGYFGYKNTNGKSAVESTISKTSLAKAQKELLLEKCGY